MDRFNAVLELRLRAPAHGRDPGDPGCRPGAVARASSTRPRSAAYPLVLDLMELFRVPLWDMVLIGSLNRNQWDPEADFVATKAKVWLSDAGRKKAIGLFESRLDETWKHPVVGYSLSYCAHDRAGGPAAGEGVDRRARALRADAAALRPGISAGTVRRRGDSVGEQFQVVAGLL